MRGSAGVVEVASGVARVTEIALLSRMPSLRTSSSEMTPLSLSGDMSLEKSATRFLIRSVAGCSSVIATAFLSCSNAKDGGSVGSFADEVEPSSPVASSPKASRTSGSKFATLSACWMAPRAA